MAKNENTRKTPVVDADERDVEVPSIVRNGPDMKNAPKPKDHQKSKAQQESEGEEYVDIDWNDLQFEVLADPDDWPVSATIAFEEGKAATAVRLLLGPEQWAEFQATNPKNKDLGSLFQTIASDLGLGDQGN